MSGNGVDREERVAQIAEEAVAPLGLLVDEVSVTTAGKRRVVRIAVDDDLAGLDEGDSTSPVPPVSLDAVADATRAIGDALDAADTDSVFGAAPYVLEVSSPGVSRPLTSPRHRRRNVGRLVEVTTTGGDAVVGRLVASDAEAMTLQVAATKKTPARDVAILHDEVASARVQVEFNRRPGEAPGGEDDVADAPDIDHEQE